MPYIYAAALYCDKCGRMLIKELEAQGKSDEYGDSERWPQYHSSEYEHTDGPEHCDCGPECLDAVEVDGSKIGAWLGNELTAEGQAYVASVKGAVGDWWRDVYGIPCIVMKSPGRRAGRRARRPGRQRGNVWFCGVDVERAQRRLARMGW